jgi:hypothetical protein
MVFAAVHWSAHGTSLPFSDVRSHVGNQGISGLVMLMLSFVDPDPSEALVARLVSRATEIDFSPFQRTGPSDYDAFF